MSGMTREAIRATIRKAIYDCVIPGCGREDDTGEPSYHKFTHDTLEDGCYGCEEKMIDWITDFILSEIARAGEEAVAAERDRWTKIIRDFPLGDFDNEEEVDEALAQVLARGSMPPEDPIRRLSHP